MAEFRMFQSDQWTLTKQRQKKGNQSFFLKKHTNYTFYNMLHVKKPVENV